MQEIGKPKAPIGNQQLRNLKLGGHVGFDSLPDQLVNKSVGQGFCFNILCIGECKARLVGAVGVVLLVTSSERREKKHKLRKIFIVAIIMVIVPA